MAHSELISTAELADILGQAEPAHLRLHHHARLSAARQRRALSSWCRAATVSRPAMCPARISSICRASSPTTTPKLRFMMPDTAQLEAAFGRHGVGNDSHVVLYSIGTAMWATRFWWMLQIARLRQRRGARRRPRQMEGGGPRAGERTGEGISARDLQGPSACRLFRRQATMCWPRAASATRSWSTRSTSNCTGDWSQAATAGPATFPEAATSRRQRWSIPRPRRSCRWRTPKRNSRRRAFPATSA